MGNWIAMHPYISSGVGLFATWGWLMLLAL